MEQYLDFKPDQTNWPGVSYLAYQLQGYMLSSLQPSHHLYYKRQGADKPTKGKVTWANYIHTVQVTHISSPPSFFWTKLNFRSYILEALNKVVFGGCQIGTLFPFV